MMKKKKKARFPSSLDLPGNFIEKIRVLSMTLQCLKDIDDIAEECECKTAGEDEIQPCITHNYHNIVHCPFSNIRTILGLWEEIFKEDR